MNIQRIPFNHWEYLLKQVCNENTISVVTLMDRKEVVSIGVMLTVFSVSACKGIVPKPFFRGKSLKNLLARSYSCNCVVANIAYSVIVYQKQHDPKHFYYTSIQGVS